MSRIYCPKKVTVCNSDLAYLQSLSDERAAVGLGRSPGTYWSQRRGANVDPLYNEPLEWLYVQKTLPIAVLHQEFEDGSEDTTTDGWGKELDGTATIPKTSWEEQYGTSITPKAGDVILSAGQYFDVVKSGRHDYNQNQGGWSTWKIGLMRRSTFEPERKVT